MSKNSVNKTNKEVVIVWRDLNGVNNALTRPGGDFVYLTGKEAEMDGYSRLTDDQDVLDMEPARRYSVAREDLGPLFGVWDA